MATKYLGNVDFNGENLKIIDTEGRGLIQNNTNEIASVKAKANLNEKKINALTPRVDTLENTVDDLGERLTVAESDVNNLEVHMAAAEDDINNLEDSVGALTNRMTSAEGNIEALTDRMNTAETNIDNLTGAVNDHTEKINNLTTDVEDLKPRMNAVEDKNTEQDKKLADLDERIVASTYEAGIGIYFGQGVEHTNINVEDELLDEIHESTRKNIEQDHRLDYIEGNYVEAVEVNDVTHNIEIKRSDGTVENTISGTVTTTPAGEVSKPTFTGDRMTSKGNFTPVGEVSKPTFAGDSMTSTGNFTPAGTVSGTAVSLGTKNVSEITSVGTLPSAVYVAADEELQLGVGSLPTMSSTVVADGSAAVTQPTFTGTQSTISVSGTPTGDVSKPKFTGTQSTISVSGTPTGDVSKPTFTGTQATEDVVFVD